MRRREPQRVPDIEANIRAVDASAKLLFGNNIDPELIRKFAAASMRVSPFVDRGIAERAGDLDTDLLPGLSLPITLAFGGNDPIVKPRIADKVKVFFPRAKTVVFPQAGHAIFLDDPERFNAMLEGLQCRKS